jgi:diguanylate cyclase (GGDEF)-like protein
MEISDRKSIERISTIRKGGSAQSAASAEAAAAPRDVLEVGGIPEVELTPNVRRALTALMAEVEELRGELADARARIGFLEKLVDEDPLMPVVNRRAFVRELTRMLAFAQRYAVPASILYFDVNNMKQINDVHGHAAGDAALVAMAQVLIDNVRTTDVVGRLGGDEMGVLLVQADQALAERKAAELAALIEARETLWQRTPIRLSVACGAYAFSQGDSAGEIITAADRAMYRAKATMKQRLD